MNLFELFVKIGVDDQASNKLEGLSSKLGNGLKTAAKIGTAAISAASGAVVALTKNAVENYAEYEQLVGGVETLFKNSADTVQQNAANAYKTAGLSANEYMSTVTSFSASLLQSLGGDTKKAAEYADIAISDMSDNANKMGTDMELIQNAYQGFAKQNYTMLDNLKLGYGGTKEEMQRLLDDAEKLPGALGRDFDISNYADVVEAIHLVQEEMGIAGTTAQEAGSTIEGSVNSMKAAWQNLLTGIADPKADFGKLIDNFVTTIVGDGTEKNKGVVGNLFPVIEEALYGIDALIARLFPIIMEKFPSIISDFLPRIFETAMMIVQTIVDSLSDPENQKVLTETAVLIIMTLATGLIDMLPEILNVAVAVILALTNELVKPENLTKIIDSSIRMIVALCKGIFQNIPLVIETVGRLILGVVASIINYAWDSIGREVVDKIKNGISNGWNALKNWFIDKWNSLFNLNVNVGFRGNGGRVDGSHAGGLSYVPYDGYIAELHKGERVLTKSESEDYKNGLGGTVFSGLTINISGAKYTDERELAEAIAERLQMMTERREAVYA